MKRSNFKAKPMCNRTGVGRGLDVHKICKIIVMKLKVDNIGTVHKLLLITSNVL